VTNITGNLKKITDNTNTMENPTLIFERLIQTTVSEALIADAVDLYAEQEIADETDRDEFVAKYSDAAYEPIIKKSVLDVVVTVVAAHTVENDETFVSIMHMLDVEEQDEMIRRMKLVMLRKMLEDAIGDIADQDTEQQFRHRMNLVETAIG
jgi:hypothetical protein